MRRDMGLIREIMFKLEAWPMEMGDAVLMTPEALQVETRDRDLAEINHHMDLIHAAGFIDDGGHPKSGPMFGFLFMGLTMSGHDFLDGGVQMCGSARKVWRQSWGRSVLGSWSKSRRPRPRRCWACHDAARPARQFAGLAGDRDAARGDRAAPLPRFLEFFVPGHNTNWPVTLRRVPSRSWLSSKKTPSRSSLSSKLKLFRRSRRLLWSEFHLAPAVHAERLSPDELGLVGHGVGTGAAGPLLALLGRLDVRDELAPPPRASELFCQDVLEDVLVQAQVRDQLLELAVLVLELLQPPQLADAEPAVHLLPAVERLLRNPIRRITSATGVPVSACFNAKAICSWCTWTSSRPAPSSWCPHCRKTHILHGGSGGASASNSPCLARPVTGISNLELLACNPGCPGEQHPAGQSLPRHAGARGGVGQGSVLDGEVPWVRKCEGHLGRRNGIDPHRASLYP